MQQFSPHDFTAFKWAGSNDFLHYITVVILLAVFLAAELNPFYLKVVSIVFSPARTKIAPTEFTVDGTRSSDHHWTIGWNFPVRPTRGQGVIPVHQ